MKIASGVKAMGLASLLVLFVAATAGAQEVRPPATKIDKMPHAANGIDPVVEFARGVIALNAKQYEVARQALERATVGAPDHYDAWGFLGAARAGLGDWAGSRAAYEQMIQLAADSAHGHAGRALALAALNDDAAAETELAWLDARLKMCVGKCTDQALLQTMIPQIRRVLGGAAATPMARLDERRIQMAEDRPGQAWA